MNEQSRWCLRCNLFVRGNHTCPEREESSEARHMTAAEMAAEIVRQRRAELVRQRRTENIPRLSGTDLIYSFLELQIQISRMSEYQRHRFMYSEIVRNLNNEFTNHVTKEIKETPVKIDECSICYNNITDSNVVELNCNHQFCGNCVNELFKLKCEPMCALCREPIKNVSSNQELITNL